MFLHFSSTSGQREAYAQPCADKDSKFEPGIFETELFADLLFFLEGSVRGTAASKARV